MSLALGVSDAEKPMLNMTSAVTAVIEDCMNCFSLVLGGGSSAVPCECTSNTCLKVSNTTETTAMIEIQAVASSSAVTPHLQQCTMNLLNVLNVSTVARVTHAGASSLIISVAALNTASHLELSLPARIAQVRDTYSLPHAPPFVAVALFLPVPRDRVMELVQAVEHSLQVSCLASSHHEFGVSFPSVHDGVEPFERRYSALAGALSARTDGARVASFAHAKTLLKAADLEVTSVDLAQDGARIDVCLVFNSEEGFATDNVIQTCVFGNSIHDPCLSQAAAMRKLIESLTLPSLSLIEGSPSTIGPLGMCVPIAPLPGCKNLLVLLNVHSLPGRPPIELIGYLPLLKLSIDRLLRVLQRRHANVFVPKRILQGRAVIPQVAAAMTAIITRSPNRAFTDECYRLLEVAVGGDLQTRLADLLNASLTSNSSSASSSASSDSAATVEFFADGSAPEASLSDIDDDEE